MLSIVPVDVQFMTLLRGGALPLRDGAGALFSAFAGHLLLAAEVDRAHVQPKKLGQWHFWLSLISSHSLFVQHFLGTAAPRRVPISLQFRSSCNLLIEPLASGCPQLLFLYVVVECLQRRKSGTETMGRCRQSGVDASALAAPYLALLRRRY